MAIRDFFGAVWDYVQLDGMANKEFDKLLMGLGSEEYRVVEADAAKAAQDVREHPEWDVQSPKMAREFRERIEKVHKAMVQEGRVGRVFLGDLHRMVFLAEANKHAHDAVMGRLAENKPISKIFARLEEKLRSKLLARSQAERDLLIERAARSPELMKWLDANKPEEASRLRNMTKNGGLWAAMEGKMGAVAGRDPGLVDVLDRLAGEGGRDELLRRMGLKEGQASTLGNASPAGMGTFAKAAMKGAMDGLAEIVSPVPAAASVGEAYVAEGMSKHKSLLDRFDMASRVMHDPLEIIRVASRGGRVAGEQLLGDIDLLKGAKSYPDWERGLLAKEAGRFEGNSPELQATASKMGQGIGVKPEEEYSLLARLRDGKDSGVAQVAQERMLSLAKLLGDNPQALVGLASGDPVAGKALEADLMALKGGRAPAADVMGLVSGAQKVAVEALGRGAQTIEAGPAVAAPSMSGMEASGPGNAAGPAPAAGAEKLQAQDQTQTAEQGAGPETKKKAEVPYPVRGMPYFVKSAVDLTTTIEFAKEGLAAGVQMRLDPASKITADKRMMDVLERADPKVLKDLYDATVAARNEGREGFVVTEAGRQKHDGLEIGRRVLGEQLVKMNMLKKDDFLKDGTPVLSEKGKKLDGVERFDKDNHIQDGRKTQQEIANHLNDIGSHRKEGARVGADLVQSVTR